MHACSASCQIHCTKNPPVGTRTLTVPGALGTICSFLLLRRFESWPALTSWLGFDGLQLGPERRSSLLFLLFRRSSLGERFALVASEICPVLLSVTFLLPGQVSRVFWERRRQEDMPFSAPRRLGTEGRDTFWSDKRARGLAWVNAPS